MVATNQSSMAAGIAILKEMYMDNAEIFYSQDNGITIISYQRWNNPFARDDIIRPKIELIVWKE